jgi:two-component system sensor kinase FixL
MLSAERLLSALLESADDAIICRDAAGTVLSWNRGAERMFGFAASEVVGRPVTRIVPPDLDSEFDDILRRAGAGERVGPFDTERVTRDGRRIPVTLVVSPILGDDGQPAGAIATLRDRTLDRRAEAALRRSEERWRAIVESAVDAVILIDRRGRVESFNASAERMFGYHASEVIGQNVSRLMPEPYASEHDGYIQRYLATRERRIIGIGREVTARRRDGSTFPAHLSVGELHLDGETKFSGIIRDLTERVSLEVRLREEQGLVRIGELAAVLAHEVKNPLAAVSGAVQMLGEHLSSDEDQEIVREILRRLDGLGALMTDLLLYARPPRPRMTQLDIAELLQALVALFRSDPAWRDLQVIVEGSTETVTADPELLKVALQNLLLNAAQAMNGRGQVHITLTTRDAVLHVDVADAGQGIPPEVREKLFTPFLTTKARGTGLGLATVRRIAEAHAGHIAILQSGRGGTTMRLSLPLSATWRSS